MMREGHDHKNSYSAMTDQQQQLINLLPDVPNSFCFKQNEFTTSDFEVDVFIRKHQNNMPLEQLREDLSVYLRNLRLSLVDLINIDYEEFIHLTTNYIDLNNNINNLMFSLGKLKKDVEQSHCDIQLTIDKLNKNLDYIRLTLKQKKDLHFILRAAKIIENIECDLKLIKKSEKYDCKFSKVAYQLSQINYRFKKLSLNSNYVNQTFKCKVEELNGEMSRYLNDKLNEFIENENKEGLNDLLESSVLNQQYDQFVDLVFQNVFKSKLQDFICDLNIEKLGILKFYNQLFDICDNGLTLFRNVNTVGVNLIDSLIDRVSKNVYDYLTINASILFLAGNPDTFILNFKETINFFIRLLSLNTVGKKVENFQIFYEIKRKFNCEIYFHIRLSEVSNQLSKALERPIVINTDQSNQVKIQLIDEFLRTLSYVWSDQIYIDTLFFDFWRLTLLLITRYTLFLREFQFENIQNVQFTYQLQSLIQLINESSLLIGSIQNIYSSTIKSRIPTRCNEFELTSSLNQSFETLYIVGLPTICKLLKQVFCSQCFKILDQVKEIPRLYRKTNRDVPSRPSTYIANCIELFQQLKQIQKSNSSNLIIEILNEVTMHFYNLANDGLDSVQKMEMSLMRLKKVQTNGAIKNTNKSIMSDADKIRLQFKLDVNFYVQNTFAALNIERTNLTNMDTLMKLVENL